MCSDQQTSLRFAANESAQPVTIVPDVILLPHFAHSLALELRTCIRQVTHNAPFRKMMTPMGKPMSVAMSNCGTFGWTASQHGYRYTKKDPLTGKNWPQLPQLLHNLANRAASQAGFQDFYPNACLINRYVGHAHMGLHQDKDEQDFSQPIVSCSLGTTAIFVIGRSHRQLHQKSIKLAHGDVLVWGRSARLMKHGIRRLLAPQSQIARAERYNLTLRHVAST